MPLVRLDVATHHREELVDVTGRIRQAVRRSEVASGVAYIYCPHTTAGVTVQENADPDVARDLLLALANAVPDRPARGEYRHGEGNSPAHVKSSLVGCSQVVPMEDGDLVLGTWQGVYLCEFDGPRTRQLFVQVIAGR